VARTSVHGDWQVRCDSPPGTQENQCAVVQSLTAEDRPDVGLTIIVVKRAGQNSPLLRVVAPMGVMLPAGLGLKIDGVDHCLGLKHLVSAFSDASLDANGRPSTQNRPFATASQYAGNALTRRL
jgi:invasion protein IalB